MRILNDKVAIETAVAVAFFAAVNAISLVAVYYSSSNRGVVLEKSLVLSRQVTFDISRFWGIRDGNAPNDIVIRWAHGYDREEQLKVASDELLQSIATGRNKVLDIYDIKIDDDLSEVLRANQNVKWLRLSPSVTQKDLLWIGEMEWLVGLSIAFADLRGADLNSFLRLRNLRWLYFERVNISAEEFSTLPVLPCLESLHLHGSSVDDQFLYHLSALKLNELKTLTLNGASITDKGVAAIVNAYELEYLSLFLVETITPQSVPLIGTMGELKLLSIGMSGLCPDLNCPLTLVRLTELLPNCHIDYGD